jgi:outer membrane protein assembly factor BamA
MRRRASATVLTLLLAIGVAAGQTAEVLGEVRVHGNHTTPDADVLSIAGLTVGTPLTEATLREAADRLRRSGRFDDVDVRKRYRSIENPSDILVIILVAEVTGISDDDLTPGPMKKFRSLGMWLPVINYADGYGFTYGARVTFVDTFGQRSRLSFPLTWGGERKVAAEADRTFKRGPFTRVEGSVSLSRRVNPAFDAGDTRREGRARVERAFTSWLRLGGGARITNVRFEEDDDTYVAPGIDLIVDTRTDPAFPRNAVHAVASVEQLRFDGGPDIGRWTADLRGYVGLFGSTVLALRAVNSRADEHLPRYEQALLGGTATLRGFDFGYRAGDNLAAFSAELRVPVTSPINMGRLGVKGFFDAGTVYPWGEKLSDQTLDRGIGGGVFMTWAVLRMGLDVAWPITAPTHRPRWHFGLGVTF